jgi:hypothetical protein
METDPEAMNNLWRGLFKSYRVVEVIPTYRMTKEDWELLDWEDLRNTAKNRIVDSLGPDFLGFAKVNIFEKGKAKPNYLWPVTVSKAERVSAGEPLEDFGNEIETELTTEAKEFSTDVDDLAFIAGVYGGRAVLKSLMERKHRVEELTKELTAILESGYDDYGSIDQALAIAMTIRKYQDSESLRKLIVELDDILAQMEEAGADEG